MATFQMGQPPESLRVVLVAGADFVTQLRRKDGTPWPVGSDLYLAFSFSASSGQTPVRWDAAFSGDVAAWNVDHLEVDALIAKRPSVARLWYVEDPLELLWAQGDLDIRR